MTEREVIWSHILDFVESLSGSRRVEALQLYIQQGGPIPDSLRHQAMTLLATKEATK